MYKVLLKNSVSNSIVVENRGLENVSSRMRFSFETTARGRGCARSAVFRIRGTVLVLSRNFRLNFKGELGSQLLSSSTQSGALTSFGDS